MKKISLIFMGLLIISFCGCQNSVKERNKKISSINNEATKETIINSNTPVHIDPKLLNGDVSSQNSSSIFEDDNYIYYCSKEGINKVDKNNGESKLISKQTNTGQLFPSGNYIYFVKSSEDYNDVGVFRIDKNGNNYFKIFDMKQIKNKDVGGIRELSVIGNKLFLNCSVYVYSYDIETKELQLIVDDIYEFDVIGDDIYYIDHDERTFTIYKKNLKSMKNQIVLGKGKSVPESNIYSTFVFVGNEMYYVTRVPNGVYYYNNKKSISISDKQTGWINSLLEYKGDIYYLERITDNDFKLMKFSPKSKKVSQVAEFKEECNVLKIVNGYAYYYSIKNNEVQSIRIQE